MDSKLDRIVSRIEEYLLGTSNTVEKGRKFVEWILLDVFDKTESELEDDDIENGIGVIISDGSYDKGIDAAFIFCGTLYLIQAKYGLSHSEDNVYAFISKMETFLNDEYCLKNNSIQRIRDLLFDRDKVNDIQIFYITNNFIDVDVFENKVSKFNEASPEICGISCRMRILGLLQIFEYQDEMANAIPSKFKGKKSGIIIENHFENREHTTIVAEVALKNLAQFVKKDREYLFYSNIRNFLGSNKINKKIAETFHNPKNFWYYNNGITIVCEDYELKNDFQLTIDTPQIVNGCQTASVIYNQWEALKRPNNLEGTILVKIIRDTNNKRADITRYTNSQNAVTGKDFFALESFQKELKKQFAYLGFNYEIQRNATILREDKQKYKGNSKYDYLFDKSFKSRKCTMIAKEVIQAYVSGILLNPAKAKSIGDYVPGGQFYNNTFNDSTPEDPRYYLFPYAIMYYSRNILEHKKDDKLRASNLLFISLYFRTILKIFNKIDLFKEEVFSIKDYPDKKKIIECFDTLFISSEYNIALIKLIENIMEQIYDDSTVIEVIGENLPKFLKNTIESERIVKIINFKIENRLNKKDSIALIDDIKDIFNL
ncbi:AIPR family protein [Ruminiclostridium herbifermentans]|uniref:AIPR family protein n=1 Tax=Ruminiclostridium herbifermentans TaxID=2488810 RepID=A0A4U7JHF7_9FIRM|nr:AIPR family protein [Ruminiclostridium herbifermentans]QNU67479.1 AIPR family protein [Ruminiclostridium herbifermentans]